MTINANARTAADLVGLLMGGTIQDPFPLYDELRELDDGVHRLGIANTVVITRHSDVRYVASNVPTFSNDYFADTAPGVHDPSDPEHRRFYDIASRLFMFSDPPRHTAVRSTFRHAFTHDAVQQWAPIVERVTDDVLGQFEDGQEIDLMPHIASDVPVAVIASILGVPQESWAKFRDWSFGYASTFDPAVLGERRAAAIRTSLDLFDYLTELVEQRTAEPADDLISHMIAVDTTDGEKLRGADLIAQIALLLIAGNETTTNLIGNGVTLLLEHPEAQQALVEDPTLWPTAIEEMLRFDPPLHLVGRKTTVAATIRDHVIEPGAQILIYLPAANRDPRAFDHADQFDIRRATNKHLSFHHGIHYCVGAGLARLKGRIIFDKLLRRFPHLRRGGEPAARRTLNVVSRGWETRPVVL